MLGLNPASLGKKFNKEKTLQAIRWAIIAELDAINFYEQLAEMIDDEKIKKVFLEVAREEKVHVGEFLALLLRYDEEMKRSIEEGFEEVKRDTNIEVNL